MAWKALLFRILTAQMIKTELCSKSNGALCTLPSAQFRSPNPRPASMPQLSWTLIVPQWCCRLLPLTTLTLLSTTCLLNSSSPSHVSVNVTSFRKCDSDSPYSVYHIPVPVLNPSHGLPLLNSSCQNWCSLSAGWIYFTSCPLCCWGLEWYVFNITSMLEFLQYIESTYESW